MSAGLFEVLWHVERGEPRLVFVGSHAECFELVRAVGGCRLSVLSPGRPPARDCFTTAAWRVPFRLVWADWFDWFEREGDSPSAT